MVEDIRGEHEKNWGMESSIHSPGLIGLINRLIARVTWNKDADIVAFIKHWSSPFQWFE